MQGSVVQVDSAMLVEMKITRSSWILTRGDVCRRSGHTHDDNCHRICSSSDDVCPRPHCAGEDVCHRIYCVHDVICHQIRYLDDGVGHRSCHGRDDVGPRTRFAGEDVCCDTSVCTEYVLPVTSPVSHLTQTSFTTNSVQYIQYTLSVHHHSSLC